jgi:hypothetical protein
LLFQGSESLRTSRGRPDKLKTRQEILIARRGRIIENEEEGIISKVDLDRKLKIVDDEAEANRHPLDEVVENADADRFGMKVSFATFPEFSGLPLEEKRELILSRFQQIRGGPQSRRLLPAAGERVEPRVDTLPQIEPDATKCMKCGRNVRETFGVPSRHCLPRSELDPQEAAREDWKYEPAPCDRKGETVHSDPAPDRIASVRNICCWS